MKKYLIGFMLLLLLVTAAQAREVSISDNGVIAGRTEIALLGSMGVLNDSGDTDLSRYVNSFGVGLNRYLKRWLYWGSDVMIRMVDSTPFNPDPIKLFLKTYMDISTGLNIVIKGYHIGMSGFIYKELDSDDATQPAVDDGYWGYGVSFTYGKLWRFGEHFVLDVYMRTRVPIAKFSGELLRDTVDSFFGLQLAFAL